MSTADNKTQRLTVEDTAQLLGVSVDAIRKRIERGTLSSERVGKTRYVLLEDADMTEHDTTRTRQDSDMTGLFGELRAHNETLRKQLDAEREASSELRRIIAALTQRIPAIEAPPETRDGDLTASEEPGGTRRGPPVSPEPEQERRSWWQRWFSP